MKFLSDIHEDVQVIIEDSAVPSGPKSYYLDGIFMQANIPNRNHRMYPESIVQREVSRYKEQFIDTKRALGELGHPSEGTINLDRASHLITKLEQNGNDFVGRAKLLGTPFGCIAKNFVDEGVRLGFSSRAFGSLKSPNAAGISEVSDDLHLSTVDCVFDPSGPDCFVNGVMEGKEWMLKEGVLTEMNADQIKKEVKALSKTQLDEGALLKIFEKFLKGL